MSYALAYWVAMFVWLLFGFWSGWPQGENKNFKPLGANLLLFILFVLIGLQVFGKPLHS